MKSYRALMFIVTILVTGLAWRFGPDLVDALRFKHELGGLQIAGAGSGKRAHDLAQTCGLCHGLSGNSVNENYPSLAGQPVAYLADQLNAFAADQRSSTQMQPLAAQLTPGDRDLIAAYYAALPPTPAVADSAVLRPCATCHGNRLQGADKPLAVPRLAGQGREYLVRQLVAYRSGRRIDPSGSMSTIAGTLDDADIQSVADAIAGKALVR